MSEERYYVLGTAGHIDHGKTSLVKALTGVDTDRFAEEQRRGITIDIGFARYTTPGGVTFGIVDVPGHAKFIRNMVAGAVGIDLVMLVVGLLALWCRFGLHADEDEPTRFLRGAMVFVWTLMILLVAVGPVISMVWDTQADVTVTFKQAEGEPYPGPYPEEYIGTAPVADGPRGLENLHLSPDSWFHVAIVWLLTLFALREADRPDAWYDGPPLPGGSHHPHGAHVQCLWPHRSMDGPARRHWSHVLRGASFEVLQLVSPGLDRSSHDPTTTT